MNKKITFLPMLVLISLLAASCGATSASASSAASSSATSAFVSSLPLSVSPSSLLPASSSFVSPLRQTKVKMYVEVESGVETDDVSLCFLDGQGDIPFIGLTDALEVMHRCSNDITVSTSEDGIVTIGREENSGTIAFDFPHQTVSFQNLDLFAASHGHASVLNLVSDMGTTDSGESKYLKSQASVGLDYNRTGKSFSIDLGKRNIPMHFENGQGYIPVQTLSDLVFSERNIYLLFNGASLYMSGSSMTDEMWASYYSVTPGNRSQKLASFSRDELALVMDLQYGLKDEHGITDFDSFFKTSGLDEQLLSTDAVTAEKGLAYMIYRDLADYHSALTASSAYAGSSALATIKKDNTIYSPNYDEYQLIRSSYLQARKAVYNALTAGQTTVKDKPDCYEEYGDTAYVTFDNFRMPDSGVDYYKTAPTADAQDTFGIVEYAHSQIFRTGSTIKNVVLDLSCNSGGSVNAGVYVGGWFLPYSILNVKNTLTGSLGSYTYQSDVDLDGKYTTSDRLSSKKLYCLVSPSSFSCSNFVASLFKDSDQVRLLGRRTYGGSCIVQHIAMADGTFFQTSGNRMLCRVQNGTFYSNDGGVDVDFTIDKLADFYNRTALTAKIDSLV
jgi:hypothetical protein